MCFLKKVFNLFLLEFIQKKKIELKKDHKTQLSISFLNKVVFQKVYINFKNLWGGLDGSFC